ncbi:MAG: hypothetical protein JNL87_20310 [Burkholderiaceae bacterium]|nr:hypothetical protein [Burkholderiaceae bacterium]
MPKGTDAPAAADADAADGADYARNLVFRIRAGTAHPTELADLVQFLASGSMLHAACVVICAAIRAASAGSATDGPQTAL